jgi:hypothetical protein
MAQRDSDLALYVEHPEEGSGRSLLPLQAARGCLQTLSLLTCGSLYRNTAGQLVAVQAPYHHKYASTLRGEDIHPPALEGLGVGAALWVDCLPWLSQALEEGGDICLQRPPVPGALVLERPPEPPQFLAIQEGHAHRLHAHRVSPCPPGSFVRYRPRLHMRIKAFEMEHDGWELHTRWRLELEEV